MGMGKQIIDAIKAGNKKFVPIADADVGGFVTQLLDPTGFADLKGSAVTNRAPDRSLMIAANAASISRLVLARTI